MSKTTKNRVFAAVNEFGFSVSAPEVMAERLREMFPDDYDRLREVVGKCGDDMPVLSAAKYYNALYNAL